MRQNVRLWCSQVPRPNTKMSFSIVAFSCRSKRLLLSHIHVKSRQIWTFNDTTEQGSMRYLRCLVKESEIVKDKTKFFAHNAIAYWNIRLKHKACLRSHMIGYHGHSSDTLKCSICRKMVRNETALDRHMLRNHRATMTTHPCTLCDKSFRNGKKLKVTLTKISFLAEWNGITILFPSR